MIKEFFAFFAYDYFPTLFLFGLNLPTNFCYILAIQQDDWLDLLQNIETDKEVNSEKTAEQPKRLKTARNIRINLDDDDEPISHGWLRDKYINKDALNEISKRDKEYFDNDTLNDKIEFELQKILNEENIQKEIQRMQSVDSSKKITRDIAIQSIRKNNYRNIKDKIKLDLYNAFYEKYKHISH